ncbi:MAG: FAD-dependent thymidylate synthase [Oscillospiraceae bacterium]|nr:FAD-dependent thymidylate synthase [Oscillospiraceae bacterium]
MLKVQLIAHTPEPEKVVASAAKLCYSGVSIDQLMAGLTPEKSREFVKMLATMGHASPTEHASFTFAIEGVSRSLLAQITRHRIGSFSVQSQRYVRLEEFDYVTPPELAGIPELEEGYAQAMREEADHYKRLADLLKEGHTRRLMAEGLSEKEAAKKAEKMAIEDARFVLPNACETKMIVTMNARSLNNFFRLRCCSRAQWEIRALAKEMLRLVYPVAPALFEAAGPACVCGPCGEGRMSCGRINEVREEYAALKKEADAQ